MKRGRGQVVDVGIVDRVASLIAPIYVLYASCDWTDARASNILDGAAPFYGAFECADGTFVSIGAIEPKFYALLLEKLGLAGEDLPDQIDREQWPATRARGAAGNGARTQADWGRSEVRR